MGEAISVNGLVKTYRTPFTRRRVEAVRGISFEVAKGEIFGFLGPNGAGKTTAIRMLMGLIKPTAGSAKIFGHEVPSRTARALLGFLPESPYFYEFLSVRELLEFTGRLFGIDRETRRRRADSLIDLVSLRHAADNPLKSYSKGMLQRAGIAQALINDPDLVVFDEPMGGLDPLGRKEVRDIILDLRERGKTVFFSSHILADVESVADRVAILNRGVVRDIGSMAELVDDRVRGTDVVLRVSSDADRTALTQQAAIVRGRGDELVVHLGTDVDVNAYLANAISAGARVVSVTAAHETLEDVFLRAADEPPRAVPGEPRNVKEEEE